MNFISDYNKKRKTDRFVEENLQRLSECIDVRKKSYNELKEEEEMREKMLRKTGSRVDLGVRSVELRDMGDIKVTGLSQSDVRVDGRIVSENYAFDKGGNLVGKGKLIK